MTIDKVLEGRDHFSAAEDFQHILCFPAYNRRLRYVYFNESFQCRGRDTGSTQHFSNDKKKPET